jgi:integrase
MQGIHTLNERKLKSLPDGMHRDGGGLFFRVRGNRSSRTWAFRYTFQGEQKPLMSLGRWPRVSLESAREKTAEANRLIDREGKDPAQVKKDERLSVDVRAGLAMKVKELVDRYMDVRISQLRSEFTRSTAARYCRQIIATIGGATVRSVTTHMLIEKFGLIELYKAHTPTARNLQYHLSAIFALGKGPCQLDKNPAAWTEMEGTLGQIAKKHKPVPHAALSYEDMGRFLERLRNYGSNGGPGRPSRGKPNTALWLEFLILSGVRSGEVRQATWDEISNDGKDWHVPPEHRKTGHLTDKVRTIPITKSMKAVLEEMRRRYPDARGGDLIFPKPSGGRYKPQAMADQIKLLKWDGPKIAAHGFRNTITDWAEAYGKDLSLLERQFDHAVPGIRKRYSHTVRKESADPTLERRRELFEEWDAYCNRVKKVTSKNRNHENVRTHARVA